MKSGFNDRAILRYFLESQNSSYCLGCLEKRKWENLARTVATLVTYWQNFFLGREIKHPTAYLGNGFSDEGQSDAAVCTSPNARDLSCLSNLLQLTFLC